MPLSNEIADLKKKILTQCSLVEDTLAKAVRSIEMRDNKLAEEVIGIDPEIDRMEVALEEDCLKILALYQPVAIDLRFIVAVLKINSDLERIGDLAMNIAERAYTICAKERLAIPPNLKNMSRKTRTMLKMSLDALVNLDTKLAQDVLDLDDDVDELNRKMFTYVQGEVKKCPDDIECLIVQLSVSRYLERIADHATNVAEDVIYMIEGEIIRHKDE